jgi:crotonyl-CoA carboxylase/reductase
MNKDLYAIAEAPPVGHVPPKMHAYTVRKERFGPPIESFKVEVVDTPEIADDEVLVYVMAAGVNYNNVWASLGVPIDVIAARQKAGEKEAFHVGGSDASGIVYKVGKDVEWPRVGDEVVVHCGMWSRDCPQVKAGVDPMYSPTFRIWGYESNWGSFAQFTKVQAHQCLPRPKHLTWEASAAYMLVGATAYRMLLGWSPNRIKKDDVVLVWGGAGGLGSMAIQIVKAFGATPVAVVSNNDKFQYCMDLGAKGCINRNDFDHWGMLPHWKDSVGYGNWLKGVRKFGKALWDAVGDKRNPNLVFEHPGETTIPTSIFTCETGGMVVICAGTTGYNATVDLRYLWMRQKRLQGSHFANDEQSQGFNNLVLEARVDPCLSRSFEFTEIPLAHQLMYENKHPHGNMAVLVGAPKMGLGVTDPAGGRRQVVVPKRSSMPVPPPAGGVHVPPRPVDSPEPEGAEATSTVLDATPVGAVMRRTVISCAPETKVDEIVHLLGSKGVHTVVVVSPAGLPLGIVSRTDLVLARQGRSPEEARELLASQVMTTGVVTCSADTTLDAAVTLMTRSHLRRLVVIAERDGVRRMAGILSMSDVIEATLGLRED